MLFLRGKKSFSLNWLSWKDLAKFCVLLHVFQLWLSSMSSFFLSSYKVTQKEDHSCCQIFLVGNTTYSFLCSILYNFSDCPESSLKQLLNICLAVMDWLLFKKKSLLIFFISSVSKSSLAETGSILPVAECEVLCWAAKEYLFSHLSIFFFVLSPIF